MRLRHDVIVRTTLDIPDQAYYLAKAIARDLKGSLGQVVGDLDFAGRTRRKRGNHTDERLRVLHIPLRAAGHD